MKPGDLVKLQSQYLTAGFFDDETMHHDGTVVHLNELMLFLGEETVRYGSNLYSRVFHSTMGKIGYVRSDKLTVVKRNHETR